MSEDQDKDSGEEMVDLPPSCSMFALDVSGSTGSCTEYYNLAQIYADKFSRETKREEQEKSPDSSHSHNHNQVYIIWDHSCRVSSKEGIDQRCKSKRGDGGTSPSAILRHIQKEKLNNIELWLITDGEIDAGEIAQCCTILQSQSGNTMINFTKVKFIVLAPGLDVSVASPFTNSTNCEIIHNLELVGKANTQNFNFDEISLDNFPEKFGELESYIKIKYLAQNYDGSQSMKQLALLKKRLLAEYRQREIHQQQQEDAQRAKNSAGDLIFSKDKHQILELVRGFRVSSTGEEKEIDKKLSTLINYIVNKHRDYSGDLFLSSHKNASIDSQPDHEVAEPPTEDSYQNYPEIPMTDVVFLADNGKPVLLLNIWGKSQSLIQNLWRDKSFATFHFVESCPLLYDPENLVPLIGHTITLEALKCLQRSKDNDDDDNDYAGDDDDDDYFHNNSSNNNDQGPQGFIIKNPNSRQKSFPLFLHDDDKINQVNDYVLSQLLFQGKKTANFELWYFALYKTVGRCEWLSCEKEFMEQLKEYAMRRISKGRCRISLTNYPLDLKNIVPIPVALLFVTEISTRLFHNCPVNFKGEKLRGYYSVTGDILSILDYLGYQNVDRELVLRRAEVFKLLQQLKQIHQQREKIRWVLANHWLEEKEGFLTSQQSQLKSKSTNCNGNNKQELLTLQQILYLAANSSMNEMVPLKVPPVDGTFMGENLLVLYKCTPEGHSNKTVSICPNTGKPHFITTSGAPFYKDVLKTYKDHRVEILQVDEDEKEEDNPTGNNSSSSSCRIVFHEEEITGGLNFPQILSLFKWFDDITVVNKDYPSLDQLKDFVRARKFYKDKVVVYQPNVVESIERTHRHILGMKDKDVSRNMSRIDASSTIFARIRQEKPGMTKEEIIQFIEESKKLVKINV